MIKAGTHLPVLAAVFLTIATAVSLPNADGNIIWVLKNVVELKKATFALASSRISTAYGGTIDSIQENGTVVILEGWAVDFTRRMPANSIQVFLDEQNVGIVKPSEKRPDVAALFGAQKDYLLGFRVIVRAKASTSLRVFAEMLDGRFVELKQNQ